jgi:arginine decarboxylase
MVFSLPDRYFLVAGFAEGRSTLNAFDNALMKAGIGNTNVVRITSILPPWAVEVPPITLPCGALVPAAYAEETSDVPGTVVTAAVACGVPRNPALPGVIMEHHARADEQGCRQEVIRRIEEAFEARGCELASIQVASASGVVQRIGSAVAAVVLWT